MEPTNQDLKHNTNIQEILQYLQEKQVSLNAMEYLSLINNLSSMQEQYTKMQEQFSDMQETLIQVQQQMETQGADTTALNPLKSSVYTPGRWLAQAGAQLEALKQTVMDNAGKTADAIRQYGEVGLNYLAELTKLQPLLTALQDKLEQTALSAQKGIEKIKAISQETQEITAHTKNLGKAITGGDRITPTTDDPGKLAQQLMKPMESVLKSCDSLAQRTEQVQENVVNLQQTVASRKQEKQKNSSKAETKAAGRTEEKPSLRSKLNHFKEVAATAETPKSKEAQAKTAPSL